MTESMIGALLATVLLLAVYLDIRTSRIPNWLTFAAMGSGLLTHVWLEGVPGAIFSMSGLGTGFILFLMFYFLGPMGAGDVKLMGAVGAMVGPYGAFVSGISAVMLGGLYAIGAMCYQWGMGGTIRRLATALRGTFFVTDLTGEEGTKLVHLRYGLAIASGTLLFRFGFHPFGG